MHTRALTRLRIGFVLLAVALLLPLYFLVRSAEARFETERRLRHEIVAERIFDEMERELTQLLDAERARPSAAYDAAITRAGSWAPFVVGYFTRDAKGLHMLAADQLAAGRAERVRAAVKQLPRGDGPPPDDNATDDVGTRAARAVSSANSLTPDLSAKSKPSAVLNQLNRAASERELKQRKSLPKTKSGELDPTLGL